jgi:hypothetical protein
MAYGYITYLAARQALALRLQDPAEIFFTDAELGLYLIEAIRTFNALTGFWIADYAITVNAGFPPWITLTAAGPRQYTLADTDLYQLILYHIIEPQLVAGIWQGTAQFTVNDLTQSYERRQNELIQFAAANISQLAPITLVPGTRTIIIPDTVLDVRRARYVPVVTPPLPQVLWRGDAMAFSSFAPAYRQTPRNPTMYDLSDRPPLSLDVDYAPTAVGSMDLLVSSSCAPANLPVSTPLVIPNDWAWVLKFGMLADLLNKQSEAQDTARAEYCLTRYAEGLQLMQICPWLLNAEFDNVPVGISAVMERDTYDPYWESRPAPIPRNGIVTAGLDLFALCPKPTGITNIGLNLELVINAPVPVLDGDFIQVPRDVLDAILDYSVHLAMFKCGGAEFQSTIPLFDSFRTVCQSYNKRAANLGLYDDILKRQGKRQEELDPRYV